MEMLVTTAGAACNLRLLLLGLEAVENKGSTFSGVRRNYEEEKRR